MTEYPSYQETNCDWIGQIPSDWKLIRGRFLFKSPKELNRDLQCDNLLSLTLSGVLNKDFKSSEGLRPDNYNTYQIFQKDDLVFKMIDLENVNTSRVGIVHEEGIMSPVYLRHEPIKGKIDPKFAYWFYYDLYKKEIYNSIGSGVRSSLSSSNLLEMELPVPSIEQQQLISRYLDKKTKQIDSLIEKIQKKIELLKEQRTSLINQCVTKGLDPNVEMEDSGVEWIGEIPSHWNSLPVRYVTEDHRQGFYTSDPYDDEGVPILRITDIQEDHFFSHWDSPKYSRPEEEIDKFYVKNGDFLFPRTGGVGRFGIVDFDFPCIYGSFMIRFRWDHSVNQNYMRFFLESNLFTDQVKQEIHGGVNQNVHVENIKDVLFFRPTLEEQTYISDYLQKKCSVLEKRISLEKKRSSLLQEYRQSLISSVVTGKVRVAEDMI